MKFFCDQGNTRLKWALVGPDGGFVLSGAESGPFLSDSTCSQVEAATGSIAKLQVGFCSVAPAERRERLASQLRDWGGVRPHVFCSRSARPGLTNGYVEPALLGVDRWLAMAGAVTSHSGPLLVVDAGTALTIDAVDGAGRHLGGYIVPGMQLQLRALGAGTAHIGQVAADHKMGWGSSTAEAVANGVTLSLVSAVERAAIELSRAVDDTCRLVLTGGDAAVIAAHTVFADVVVDPQLLFRGMLVELPPSS